MTAQVQEFEPKCDWVHEDGCHTLLVHVPGFKRENLKKEFKLPEDCDVNGISAKFEGEVLRVRLPKTPAVSKEEEAKQEAKHTAEDHDKASSEAQDQKAQRRGGDRAREEASEGLLADKPATEEKYQKMHPRNLLPKKTKLLAVLIVAVAVALGLGMLRPKGPINQDLNDRWRMTSNLTKM
uniref:SHSP domain-containing protein n=1 Tax=Kalanchoe fedtschenkoi TaxID=63787 RepID=A0A7N1A0B1_KALFE